MLIIRFLVESVLVELVLDKAGSRCNSNTHGQGASFIHTLCPGVAPLMWLFVSFMGDLSRETLPQGAAQGAASTCLRFDPGSRYDPSCRTLKPNTWLSWVNFHQLSQFKMAIKWSWSSQHRLVPKLGWWLSPCPRHTLYHSSERQTGAGAVWCSSHQQNPLAYSLSNWNTNVFHLYSKSEFPGYMFICHPCVIHPCHSMSMVGSHISSLDVSSTPWKNIHRCSSVSCQDRWTSGTHPRVHGIHLRAKWQFGEVPDSGARVIFRWSTWQPWNNLVVVCSLSFTMFDPMIVVYYDILWYITHRIHVWYIC